MLQEMPVMSSGGGGGGQSQSGTFTVPASSWGGVTLGFQPKKLYIGFDVGTSASSGAGYCVYDEEQNVSRYVYRSSSSSVKNFENFCHINSNGFEIKNDFGSAAYTCYYLAEG
jgi:hypothetical protein